jgi:hypothetical protein
LVTAANIIDPLFPRLLPSRYLGIKHSSGAQDEIFTTVSACLLMWGALSDERTGRLQLLLVLASAVILGSESRGTHDHISLSQIREGPVPVFISPRKRVPQLYPQALGSLFVFYYDSQGYSGGIRTRLHTG